MKVILILILFIFTFIAHASDVQIPSGKKLSGVQWSDPKMKSRFGSYFNDIVKKDFDALSFKIHTDAIAKELFSAGYFNAVLESNSREIKGKWYVEIKLVLNKRINFEFLGNARFSQQELRNNLVEKIKNDFGKLDGAMLEQSINELYEGVGIYATGIKYYTKTGLDLDKNEVTNYYFSITEGHKIKVEEILFRGNLFYTKEEINDFYKKNGTDLSLSGHYDKDYLEEFSEILKKEYLRQGYVFIDVSKPRVIKKDEKTFAVEFGISEKHQVILDRIDFGAMPSDLALPLKENLINKEFTPVNVVEMENDLRKMIIYLQNEGYYFSTITNLNAESLITYDPTFTTATLKPEINLDRKICFNDTIINGNVKTKSIVLLREINFLPGELITPTKLEYLRQKLSGLNLFSSLRITPFVVPENTQSECPKTNIVIQVKEKDFGLIEVAPGYRTDLGAKLSSTITYNNLGGMNRSLSLKVQANRRFNLAGFDDRRKDENRNFIEHSARVSFAEPYLFYNIFKTQVEFEMSATKQKNRYYGFDADIFRISPQLSKTFNKWLSTSVSYQFEQIDQYDATITKDNDNFSIGGITPTITFDFRDDVINPRKGAFFTLSSEWANSNFGSMRSSDLEVNFIKMINRNRFYIPMGTDFTLAISVAMGYQKNFATELVKDSNGNPVLNANGKPKTRGYIPSIKVFRLDGYDEIRGYDESEINRLMNGTPIGDIIVQGEAYFTALKVEQRYSLNDNIRLGVFFDAGRVFVDDFQATKLRTSVGAGIKFVTPVGSLDFDYGFKLQRKEYGPSTQDSVGRFHLSIGYF